MRILIKGGVWKNTEDEILKAAVMKYGKNGWSRVASLLNRKSARQCKARWYEWLDPSIKKTDWNKDEEEKLLHLAKLMPNQWRTIAPIVGRTAAQCMEHYERLLDQAQDEVGEPSSDDPRRLRPGEIDPAPETKPARPDPIDMDEDEKEMLSEARARLANTLGKKAKRKARERQLGESRRLSMLQKRRELKAAGIESKLGGGKKRKFIDYATEIPFQMVPPSGFYEVNAERAEGKKEKLDPSVHGLELAKMEGRHQKEEEEKNKAKDARAMKKLYKENAPLAIAKASADNDPASLRRRMPLSLPSPQVQDGELEEIVKLGQNALMAPPTGLPTKGATHALIADYSQQSIRALPTPSRTPMQEDIIMQEARNQRALREMTPLFGEVQELPELHEGTGFGGIEPRKAHLATPNTFLNMAGATPSRGGASVMNTPGGASLAGSSVAGSVLRDPFGLNSFGGHDDTYSVSDMASISSRSEKNRGKFLMQQLKGLPEPEYLYEVALPEHPAEEDLDEDGRPQGTARVVEDAAEVHAKKIAAQRQREAEELSRRSSVLKKGLPRPSAIPAEHLCKPSLSGKRYTAEVVAASGLINQEMVRIIQHDSLKFPTIGDFELDKYSELENIPDSYLAAARDLLKAELPATDSDKGRELMATFTAVWERLHEDLMFVPVANAPGAGVMSRPKNTAEWLKCLSLQYAALKAKFDKDAKRATKIEGKLQVTTLGYVNRNAQLQQTLIDAADTLSRTRIEAECFAALYAQEERALARRLAQLKKELAEAEEQEAIVQQKYAEMVSFSREQASMQQ